MERRRHIREQLESLAIPFEFFDAVDGFGLTSEQLARYRPQPRPDVYGKPMAQGEIGCLASFLSVFERIAEGPDAFACVLEDDAVLSPHISLLLDEATLRSLAPFDFLKLHHWGGLHLPIAQIGETRIYAPIRPGGGTWAQIVSREGAAKIVAHGTPFRAPFDMMIYDGLIPDFRVLTAHPEVASRGDSPSTIDPQGNNRGPHRVPSIAAFIRRKVYLWKASARTWRQFIRLWGMTALFQLRG